MALRLQLSRVANPLLFARTNPVYSSMTIRPSSAHAEINAGDGSDRLTNMKPLVEELVKRDIPLGVVPGSAKYRKYMEKVERQFVLPNLLCFFSIKLIFLYVNKVLNFDSDFYN